MTSVLSELTCLSLRRPGPDATPRDLALFYDEIGRVREHLAAAASTAGEREHELALAESARHHARTLRSLPDLEAAA